MGSELVAEARAVHEEVLKAEDVPEEEMVSMVWHDQGDSADATDAGCGVDDPEGRSARRGRQNKKPRSRRQGNARP